LQVRTDGGGEGRAERSEGRPLGIRPLNKRAKRAKEREDSDYPPALMWVLFIFASGEQGIGLASPNGRRGRRPSGAKRESASISTIKGEGAQSATEQR
jgi:hypothetical protein